MTGFARATVERAGIVATWELRSLNGKGLDLRLKMPPGLDRVGAEHPPGGAENVLPAATSRRCWRSPAHRPSRSPWSTRSSCRTSPNWRARLQDQYGVRAPSADGLLALRGVLEFPEQTSDEDSRKRARGGDCRCVPGRDGGVGKGAPAGRRRDGRIAARPSDPHRGTDSPGGKPIRRARWRRSASGSATRRSC